MSKATRRLLVVVYCLALWVTLDFIYSHTLGAPGAREPSPRTRAKDYHHGLVANFAGHDRWGPNRYPFFTNSLGLRDAAPRDVPKRFDGRRIVLIGDSFTEGTGVAYEASFAGLLAQAPAARQHKLEFLNAGVVSYSPVIYYKRIKHLLDSRLAFDEVVVFPDISDVQDEATGYFCIDDDAAYRKYCNDRAEAPPGRKFFSNFVISYNAHALVKNAILTWRGGPKARMLNRFPRSGWTIPGFDVGNRFAPLGVEGGIARSVQNMQALADLLKARGIPLTVVVFPWPMQLAHDDRDSRHVAIWRDFCATNCKAFIDVFPAFFAEKDAHADWYERLFIYGDMHFSAAGNRLVFRELAKHLLPGHATGERAAAVGIEGTVTAP